MAYDHNLADRISFIFQQKKVDFYEKKMFGGICFMVDGKMCVGVMQDELMARIGIENYQDALEKNGAKEMNFTGRAMKGYVYVEPQAIEENDKLAYWIQLSLDFNPFAKASKKRRNKA